VNKNVRISDKDILTLNHMSSNSTFFFLIKYKMKPRHFSLMFEILNQNKIRDIFRKNISFFCKRKNLLDLLYKSKHWTTSTDELVHDLNSISYVENRRLNMVNPYLFSLLSRMTYRLP
jgi:hypothetical protein